MLDLLASCNLLNAVCLSSQYAGSAWLDHPDLVQPVAVPDANRIFWYAGTMVLM